MLLKNYILQCVYTTLQSNVLIRDSYENKDPRKQALGFMRKQKKNKRQINKYKFAALWSNTKKVTQHKIAIFSTGDSKFWKQWQIQRLKTDAIHFNRNYQEQKIVLCYSRVRMSRIRSFHPKGDMPVSRNIKEVLQGTCI